MARPTSPAAAGSQILSGNLSFQIEHHLFPDLPASRYEEMSVEVKEICERYGVPYHNQAMHKQLASVWKKIFKLALPDRKSAKLSPFRRALPKKAKELISA